MAKCKWVIKNRLCERSDGKLCEVNRTKAYAGGRMRKGYNVYLYKPTLTRRSKLATERHDTVFTLAAAKRWCGRS